MSEQFPSGSEFGNVVDGFGEEDRLDAALGVNADMMRGLESGEIHADDPRVQQSADAIEGLMGPCDYPRYCKFYGEGRTGICDRSCGESIWDQI
jgi:hypothetical protein